MYFFIFLILGLLIFFHTALISKFDTLFGGYDNLYYNYVLEHSYLWIKGIHNSFYGAPFNYYDSNSIAQADNLFAILPIYWFIRIFKSPFSSFQILYIVLSILNYSCFYYFLRQLKLKEFSSSVGAFIFAFSILRYFNFDNFPTTTQFLSILSVIFVLKVKKENKSLINHLFFIFSTIFLILQFYSCFSVGFFSVFCSIFAILLSLLPKNSRDIVIKYFKDFYRYILFYVLVFILSLFPLIYHFILLNYCTPLSELLNNFTNYSVWLRSLSVIDFIFTFKMDYIFQNPNLSSMSMGLITTIVSLFALYKTPKVKGVSLLTFVFIVLISSGYSAIYFWKVFYYFSFGIESLNSAISCSFVILVIVSIGIGLFFNNSKNKALIFVLLILVVMEQICYDFDKNSTLKNNFISKRELISKIKNIEVKEKYVNIQYIAKNKEEYGIGDIKLKNITAQKQADLLALWVGIKVNKPVINSYFKKVKPQKPYYSTPINFIVDYNQI